MPAERPLNLSFNYDSVSWWNHFVDDLGKSELFVRILPAGGGRPFDAYIAGVDREADAYGSIKYYEGTPQSGPTGDPKSVVAEKIYVY